MSIGAVGETSRCWLPLRASVSAVRWGHAVAPLKPDRVLRANDRGSEVARSLGGAYLGAPWAPRHLTHSSVRTGSNRTHITALVRWSLRSQYGFQWLPATGC